MAGPSLGRRGDGAGVGRVSARLATGVFALNLTPSAALPGISNRHYLPIGNEAKSFNCNTDHPSNRQWILTPVFVKPSPRPSRPREESGL